MSNKANGVMWIESKGIEHHVNVAGDKESVANIKCLRPSRCQNALEVIVAAGIRWRKMSEARMNHSQGTELLANQ